MLKRNVTLTHKIAAGFAALLVMLVLVGGISISSMRSSNAQAQALTEDFIPEAQIGAATERNITKAQLDARSYALTRDAKYLQNFEKNWKKVEEALIAAETFAASHSHLAVFNEKIKILTKAQAEFAAQMTATREAAAAVDGAWSEMNAAAGVFVDVSEQLVQTQLKLLQDDVVAGKSGDELADRVTKVAGVAAVRDEGNQVRIAVLKFATLHDETLIAGLDEKFAKLLGATQTMRATLKRAADIELMRKAEEAIKTYQSRVASLHAAEARLAAIAPKRIAAIESAEAAAAALLAVGMDRTVEAGQESATTLARTSRLVLIAVAAAIGLGIVLTIWLSLAITRPVRAITETLAAGSQQTAAASNQVSAASQAQAEGASEQAATLEETSSSLEEIASMVKRNADHAESARTRANEARAAAETGGNEMKQMSTAMRELVDSSTAVLKIVKTIDEIAFQTNLLALNAAVEAARAGEAGAGFAVVADEVRSLAQRSAVAAKETASLVDDTHAKSKQGAELSARVSNSLSTIIEHSRGVDTLITEIATACSEQSQGIHQLNGAVGQMDQVIQGSAAQAEETASAAEELSAQASELRAATEQLRKMVGLRGETTGLPDENTRATRGAPRAARQLKPRETRTRHAKEQVAPEATTGESTHHRNGAHANEDDFAASPGNGVDRG
jgi:methyl-accepting chemotaxis protein